MAATRNLTTYRALLESLYVEQDLKMRQVMKHMEMEYAIKINLRTSLQAMGSPKGHEMQGWVGVDQDTRNQLADSRKGPFNTDEKRVHAILKERAYRVQTGKRMYMFVEGRVPVCKPRGYRIETTASSTPKATPVPDLRLLGDTRIPPELGALDALDEPVPLAQHTIFVEEL
ncbi:hypothetical protein CPLU01_03246 [Colletotrichum plurivorum]|uniref:Clr5 domain-containing protein n=1 Tax=Colletotrichum plurivorum TaxID=2175906 RepID=A0A8H6KT01_9PEZI|nr:hypothetical protein CPLU01_03246 [Colletotrichum plurivorum]